MSLPSVDSLLALDVETRLELVQKLWDSIFQDAQQGVAMPVSAQERELLDARLKEDDDDPDAAITPGGRPGRGPAPR
jgi:putative addiction module component (TIGR02574 family)